MYSHQISIKMQTGSRPFGSVGLAGAFCGIEWVGAIWGVKVQLIDGDEVVRRAE